MTRSISLLAADDRVELALAGELGEVAAERVERRASCSSCCRVCVAAAGPRRSLAVVFFARLDAGAEELEHLFADLFELDPEVHQHLGGDALVLLEQAEQQVLGADVVVVEAALASSIE